MFLIESLSYEHILSLREVRNACREYMTRDTHEIDIGEQMEWWKEYKNNDNIWCYIAKKNNKVIGYGLVRYVDKKYWLSGGLLPEVRGQGFGERLFQHLINEFKYMPWLYLEVLDTNKGAYKLYRKLGFKKVSQEKNVITMRRKING